MLELVLTKTLLYLAVLETPGGHKDFKDFCLRQILTVQQPE
jgi:hypothetical protein